MMRRFSTIKLSEILDKKYEIMEKYKYERCKTAYHLAKSDKLYQEINEITAKAAQYCEHEWVSHKNEYISYCKICGINDDYKIFGVKVRFRS